MNHVIVAFESEGASKRVCEMLTAASVPVRAACRTGAEVIRLVRYMGGGVVVCGVKLSDTTADRLYEDLDGQVYVLAVGKPEQLDMCDNPRVFRLPLPVNRYDLSASVRMLEQLEEMSRRDVRPPQDELETIRRAKLWMMEHEGLSEEEAHRRLQRQSMTARRRMAEVAASILERARRTETNLSDF